MKIGFCFLVKNKISKENLWGKFFDTANISNYSVYIHAKTRFVSSSLSRVSVDPNPIETEWASISLVKATKRLLETAFNDGCNSVIFLSGDSLPLWNFKIIQRVCTETLFSLQPKQDLLKWQTGKNNREYERIRKYYQLDPSFELFKQNMFFCIKKSDYNLIENISIDLFPSQEVPDEYFWANQLLMHGNNVFNSNFIYANDDTTKTQSLSWIVDGELLHQARSKGFLFIRKVTGFSDIQTKQYYASLISQ